MSTKDFDKLKKNIGGLLSFTSFLSTTTDERVSIAFVEGSQNDVDIVGVLFFIDIDPSIKSSPFAFVTGHSYFECEDEVLFSMNTVFRVCSIELTQNGLWYVNIQLTSDDDVQLRELTRYIRDDIQGSTDLSKLAYLLRQMSESEKSREIYELLLETTDETNIQELAFLERQLGLTYHRMGDLNAALKHYHKTLALKLTVLPNDDPSLAINYSNIGTIFYQEGNFNEALEYYRHALKLNLKEANLNQESIAHCHNNIGLVLRSQEKYSEALESLQCAMDIDLQRLPSTHPVIANTYASMSSIYSLQRDYAKADEYSNKSFDIMHKCLPPKHLDFSFAHIVKAEALEGLLLYDAALQHAQLAVDILLDHSFPPTHCDRQKCEKILKRIQTKI